MEGATRGVRLGLRAARRHLYREVSSLLLWRLEWWRSATATWEVAAATKSRSVALGRDFIQNLGYGARTLLRRPGFSMTAIAVLGLGIGAPTLGRAFLPEENGTPGTHPVVVLGHHFWTRAMGSDSAVVGRDITLGRTSYTVVGIAPEGFGSVSPISPGTARQDRFTKRRLYQEVGVPVYWIVDPDQKAVEIWTPEVQFPSIERERVVWMPAAAEEPFVLELEDLFKPI